MLQPTQRCPASELPPALPGSQNHRPPLIDSSLSLVSPTVGQQGSSQGSFFILSHLPEAWTAQATDAWVSGGDQVPGRTEKQQPG